MIVSFIFWLSRVMKIDLLTECYRAKGILNFENSEVSGEAFFVEHWMPRLIEKNPELEAGVVLDVGANEGAFTECVLKVFPERTVYAFEPHPETFASLQEKFAEDSSVNCVQALVGEEDGKGELFCPEEGSSEHFSTERESLERFLHYDKISSVELPQLRLDRFLEERGVERVLLLKVDIEGSEFECLSVLKDWMAEGKIAVIQFEFNFMNITKRVFMKDFVDLLDGYRLFRLSEGGLVRMKYSPREEIFLFQNIVAVSEGVNLPARKK